MDIFLGMKNKDQLSKEKNTIKYWKIYKYKNILDFFK